MKKIFFTKMHGIGNDFIVIEEKYLIENNIKLSEKLIKDMCLSHTGVGADGLIVISKGEKLDFKYVMYNFKGLNIKLSGNGLRCYMRYLSFKGLIDSKQIEIETSVGKFNLNIDGDIVMVDMGKAYKMKNFAYGNKKLGDIFPIRVNKEEFIFFPVGLGGSPNAVIFLKKLNLERLDLPLYAKDISGAIDIFKNQTNVEFVKIISETEISMRAWGRKSGETLACGTGACASVVAGITSGKLKPNLFIKVNVKGGLLEVKWSGNVKDSVIIRGGTKIVFEGDYYINS